MKTKTKKLELQVKKVGENKYGVQKKLIAKMGNRRKEYKIYNKKQTNGIVYIQNEYTDLSDVLESLATKYSKLDYTHNLIKEDLAETKKNTAYNNCRSEECELHGYCIPEAHVR